MSSAFRWWTLPTNPGNLAPMSANESPAERLARYVLERRDELDLTQLDVWQAKGPSNTTLTKIENGLLAALEKSTARKLDKALQWEPGSARAIWVGGEPTPLPPSALAPEVIRELEEAELSDAARAFIRAALERDAEQARGEGRRQA